MWRRENARRLSAPRGVRYDSVQARGGGTSGARTSECGAKPVPLTRASAPGPPTADCRPTATTNNPGEEQPADISMCLQGGASDGAGDSAGSPSLAFRIELWCPPDSISPLEARTVGLMAIISASEQTRTARSQDWNTSRASTTAPTPPRRSWRETRTHRYLLKILKKPNSRVKNNYRLACAVSAVYAPAPHAP